MSQFDPPSRDYRSPSEPGDEFIESLQRETRRRLPAALSLKGTFPIGDIRVPYVTIRTEELKGESRGKRSSPNSVRYLTINIPPQDLGKLARGTKRSPKGDAELGKALLTDILESTKRKTLGAFQIFADEQKFLVAVFTDKKGDPFEQFGRVHDRSFLRLVVPLELQSGPYREAHNSHLMDRLTKLFDLIHEQGLPIAEGWIRHLEAERARKAGEAELSTPPRAGIPPVLSPTRFKNLMHTELGIEIHDADLPRGFPCCDDREVSMILRIPISSALVSQLMQCSDLGGPPVEVRLDHLRRSLEVDLESDPLTHNVRVHLRSASEMERIEGSEEASRLGDLIDLKAWAESASKGLGRYLLSVEIDFTEVSGTEKLRAERELVMAAIITALKDYARYLGNGPGSPDSA